MPIDQQNEDVTGLWALMALPPAPQSGPDSVPSAPPPSYSDSNLHTSPTEPLPPYTPYDSPLPTYEETYWARHADLAACDVGNAERRLEETSSRVAYSRREYDYLVDEYNNMMPRSANREVSRLGISNGGKTLEDDGKMD